MIMGRSRYGVSGSKLMTKPLTMHLFFHSSGSLFPGKLPESYFKIKLIRIKPLIRGRSRYGVSGSEILANSLYYAFFHSFLRFPELPESGLNLSKEVNPVDPDQNYCNTPLLCICSFIPQDHCFLDK